MEMIGVAISGGLGQPEAGKTGEQDRQRGRHFEARQRRSDAEVDPCAKGEMRVGIPPAVERVGPGKAIGVAIGGAEQKANLLPFLQLDAGELDIFQRATGKEMERRVEPQHFLDRRGPARFGRKRALRIYAMLQSSLDAVADGVNRRLMAGVEQENAGRDELVLAEPAAIAFDAQKLADQIVAKV